MDAQAFYDQLAERLGVQRREDAIRAAEAVLVALHLRLHEDAAGDVQRRLPPELQRLWPHGGEALKRERNAVSDFTRGQFINYVGDRLGIGNYQEAERTIRAVFATLREAVPEVDGAVREAVPEDIRELWRGATPAAVRGGAAR